MKMLPARQSGATLLILLLLMMTVFATLLVSSLRGRNPEDIRREQSTAAIEKARQALLAWSLSRDGAAQFNPTELPCPADPNETQANSIGTSRLGTCTSVAARVGWLPWKTLGIPKIVDAYGEPLWYSVDLGFLVRGSGNPARKVNSDSLSVLQVFAADGVTNYSLNGETAAAVIFAPGPPLAGQNRSGTLTVAQYLEGVNGQNNATLGGSYIAGDLSTTFNDQLGVITGRELMDRVAARLGAEVSQQLGAYYQAFAANYPGLVSAPISLFAKQNMLAWLQRIVGLTAPAVNAAQDAPCVTAWSSTVTYLKNAQVSYTHGTLKNFKAKENVLVNTPPMGQGNDPYWDFTGTCSGIPPTPVPTTPPITTSTPNPSITPSPSVTPVPSITPVSTASPVPLPAPYPYPADMSDGDGDGNPDMYCRDNVPTGMNPCASKTNLCAGIFPRWANSWIGFGLLPSPAPSQLASWFQQNIWHRAIFYAVKQGTCMASFSIDGSVDVSIDALFILSGAPRAARANNLAPRPLMKANASTDLTLYLDDVANQNKWLNPNDRLYVTPSCTSNDVMYTCSKGVCSKRKRAC